MGKTSPVRLLIVDDHPAFALGLRVLLSADPELTPVITVTEPTAVLGVVTGWFPDVVVMSLELGEVSAIPLVVALQALRSPPLVITFTAHADPTTTIRAMEAGAVGFLTKDVPIEDVSDAIKLAVRGGTWIPARLLSTVVTRLRGPGNGSENEDDCMAMLGQLTSRELEVLRLMVSGLDRSAISARLYRSPNTVRTHIGSIMTKIGAHSAVEAVAIALRAGMRPEPPYEPEMAGARERGGVVTALGSWASRP